MNQKSPSIPLKKGRRIDCEDIKQFQAALLISETVKAADKLIETKYPKRSYADKFNILRKCFNFTMVSGYIPEDQPSTEKAKADYLFTLQHLLNKAKVVGLKEVMKQRVRTIT